MIRIHVICEGKSEAVFVQNILSGAFSTKNIALLPALIGTAGHKGGNLRIERLLDDIEKRLLGDKSADCYCTTFFDFYGLAGSFPGKKEAEKLLNTKDKAQCVQRSLKLKVQEKVGTDVVRRFIPYVQMYEFEALLFSDPIKFCEGIGQPDLVIKLQKISDKFESPEAINNSPETAPSKRIAKLYPRYDKPLHGIWAAREIGLPVIRKECHLFNAWLQLLESLVP